MPIENRSFGAVLPRHFDGIGLNLIAAFPAPYDEAHRSRRRTPEGHRRAGLGFHLTASAAISSAARRLVNLPLRKRFAFRLGSDHIANAAESSLHFGIPSSTLDQLGEYLTASLVTSRKIQLNLTIFRTVQALFRVFTIERWREVFDIP